MTDAPNTKPRPALWQDKPRFTVLETGFGAGTNFLSVWAEFEATTKPHQHLHYYAVEKSPLSVIDIQKSHSGEYGDRFKKLIENYPMRIGGWHTLRLSPQITLTLIFDDIKRALPELDTPIDYWMTDDAEFKNTKTPPLTTQLTALAIPHKIAIIGGGIAGAALAYTLSARGRDVTLFEKNGLASGGSGNHIGLCNTRITGHRGPEADFYSTAFNLAHRIFANISSAHDIGFDDCGCLHLIIDAAKDKRYTGFANKWGWHSDHARIIDARESSDVAGVNFAHPSLYLPDAAMISPKKTTEFMAAPAKIVMRDITSIEQSGTGWIVDGDCFDCVVLAGSFDVLKFPMTKNWPIDKVRGQITEIAATELYARLKTNLSYGGYASLAKNGEAVIGSTFQTWIDDPALRTEDDLDNIQKLELASPELAKDLRVIGGRASFRSAARDRAPVIGRIYDFENLYTSTAHGSHGILSSMMGAEFITSKIMGDAPILPQSVERFLSPARFKKKYG